MADVPLVDIVNGLPTGGTGTVQTISNITDRIGPLNATKETNPDAASATELALLRGMLQATIDATVTSGTIGSPSTEFVSVIGPVTTKVSNNFTCPNNTSHVANDNISDNSTAGSVTKLSFAVAAGKGTITRIRVKKSDQTVATPSIRVWLWDTTFTVASGDDAAFSQPLTDAIGFADVAVINAGTDDAVGWTNCAIPFVAGTVFGLLQTLTTFTVGASEVFTVDLWYVPG